MHGTVEADMPDPSCHYCERIAESECPTCGRFYCDEHGDDVCLRCLSPDSATPTALAYRGSLIALGVASIVAVFLLISPPESPASMDEPEAIATNTPAFEATATPTVPTDEGTGEEPNTEPTTTIATPTEAAEPSPTPEGEQETYTIESGDSLSTIAADHGVTVDAILAANPEIEDPAGIVPGQEIVIPAGE
ncbi:MAG: LysM peptidoglycan-binding domain-containing protein [Dehalococcoidia bacterium]|nr:LysM peptidoglycan-binding domain-containing protein [Dehalococcoidia bacterium]